MPEMVIYMEMWLVETNEGCVGVVHEYVVARRIAKLAATYPNTTHISIALYDILGSE